MKKIVLSFILIYQKVRLFVLSFFSIAPTACRFEPSCSIYAYQSVNKHGIIRGGIKALKRIASCHPFNPGGWDPVR